MLIWGVGKQEKAAGVFQRELKFSKSSVGVFKSEATNFLDLKLGGTRNRLQANGEKHRGDQTGGTVD